MVYCWVVNYDEILIQKLFLVDCWIVKYDEILDEAFVVFYYWVVNYDEILIQKLFFVDCWIVKYDEILDEAFVVCDEIWMKLLWFIGFQNMMRFWMKLLVVYWVVKYDEIWMIGAMIFAALYPSSNNPSLDAWITNLGWRSSFFCCPASLVHTEEFYHLVTSSH